MPDLITIIEDDESIREMLRYYFHSVGYGVEDFESGEDYFQAVHDVQPDLYILDIMLPGMDGLEILRRLRGAPDTAHIPVIMLTARTAELDRVKGLEQGADDYVVKPFGIMELQARVKAVLRRTGRPQTPAILKCDGLEIDPAAREVRRDGIPVELTYKEFELLKLLCENRGTVLTRDDILHAVWDYDFAGETRTVDMHVKTLRQKLGEGYIQTVRGVGYKMP
ncbi:MAG: response regulator transcription factor [Clostridiales bacterium]|uniref:Stage 0 sporulation protein A homolog n=1 Tax=Intestinimonas massiliensis (ex Afouda et al. 2020) TaxID=1673721 RepID=A0ABS9M4M8_9FIRM|nr:MULTISPECIES: response regulator transcription factor [Intestinimonas]MBS6281494.1 response regulator transcription factor [Oscillospiraceae bacterium]MDU1323909.1 response regulator transcription factor [Clostridiales bacterium]MCG4525752.1 response regulator transcription factor [Intestinimonas massiliensis (ex Afouda et al. 2020)]MCI5563423.1 response regulator transcription factor [Intestinimonas massiliensis (ex Afouda et al. 2020)]MCQ4805808.1 response regulator transcription factor [